MIEEFPKQIRLCRQDTQYNFCIETLFSCQKLYGRQCVGYHKGICLNDNKPCEVKKYKLSV